MNDHLSAGDDFPPLDRQLRDLGIVTVENHDQAIARSEPAGGHNVGEEATAAAIEMAVLAERLRPG